MKFAWDLLRKRSSEAAASTFNGQLVLAVLLHGKCSSLDIAERVYKATDGRVELGQSSLYPLLRSLEDSGSLWTYDEPAQEGERGGRPRRFYGLTAEGFKLATQAHEQLDLPRPDTEAWIVHREPNGVSIPKLVCGPSKVINGKLFVWVGTTGHEAFGAMEPCRDFIENASSERVLEAEEDLRVARSAYSDQMLALSPFYPRR